MSFLKPPTWVIVFFIGFLASVVYVFADTEINTEQLECVTLFDFVTAFIAPSCPIDSSPTDKAKIADATGLLSQHGFATDATFEDISINFCPLQQGLGLVRQADTMLVDDALRLGSNETLAEVIAHEMEHLQQIRAMGEDKFKCIYIDELIACGGCVDKNHALEAPAYAMQAKVRDVLLKHWLERSR